MEKACTGQDVQSTSGAVYELIGEPAVIINGVLDVTAFSIVPVHSSSVSDFEPNSDPLFGKLLEGRKVWKIFGDQYFSGKVVEYDSEANWYRVVYEDGDLEDLEWHELEDVLVPLDISLSLTDVFHESSKYEILVSDSRGKHAKAAKYRLRKSGSHRKASGKSREHQAIKFKGPELKECCEGGFVQFIEASMDMPLQNNEQGKVSYVPGENSTESIQRQTTGEVTPILDLDQSSCTSKIDRHCIVTVNQSSDTFLQKNLKSQSSVHTPSATTSRAEKQKRKDNAIEVAISEVNVLPFRWNSRASHGQHS